MFYFLQVVPIIIPQDPAVRAEIATSLSAIGEWLLLGAFLAFAFEGVITIIKAVSKFIRYVKNRKKG